MKFSCKTSNSSGKCFSSPEYLGCQLMRCKYWNWFLLWRVNDDQNTFRSCMKFQMRDFFGWVWGLQLLLVQKIINIQFFITQSNTDASIIESKREIHNSSKLIAPVWSLKQQQNFFFCCTFRWNDLCDYVKCCVGRLYRFSTKQCYGNCNKSTRAVVFPPLSVTFWLKCKCKFAHETDGSCNTQQTNFPGFEGKGNRNPFAITYRSTFFPVVLFSSFLHSRKGKNCFIEGNIRYFPRTIT